MAARVRDSTEFGRFLWICWCSLGRLVRVGRVGRLRSLQPLGSLKSAEFVKIRSIRWAARLLRQAAGDKTESS